MFIKDIKKEKSHLVRLYFQNGEELLIDKDVCSNEGLKKGSKVEDIEELKNLSDYCRGKSRALWYLDRKDYTEKELYNKLLRAGFNSRISAQVVARLKELGLVDDKRFARNYAEKNANANISKRASISKMLNKGVPYELAKATTQEVEVDENTQLENLIEKKYLRKLQTENGLQKVYSALVRRGFSYGAVKSILKKYSQELEFSEE